MGKGFCFYRKFFLSSMSACHTSPSKKSEKSIKKIESQLVKKKEKEKSNSGLEFDKGYVLGLEAFVADPLGVDLGRQ